MIPSEGSFAILIGSRYRRGRRDAFRAIRSARAAASRRGRIDRQRDVLAECRLQTLDGAILIAAARAAADADGADHLPVDNDREATRVREEIKICALPRNAVRIDLELRGRNGGGLARLQRGLCLQQRGTDVVVNLTVHALHVHEFPGIIDDVERHRAVLRRRPVATDAGDLLRCRERNLIAVKDVSRALAADYEFRGQARLGWCGGGKAWNRRIPRIGVLARRKILYQRRDRWPQHFDQRLVRANFVAPHGRVWSGTTDADGADQLFVDDDGQPARIRKEAELHLLKFLGRILDHPVHTELARRAIHERGTRLHVGGHDIEIALTVHAIHVDMVAVTIEHHDADLHAFGRGGLLARIGNALRSGQIDGSEILNLVGGFAADDELLRYVLSERHTAKRDCANCGQSHETKLHFILP